MEEVLVLLLYTASSNLSGAGEEFNPRHSDNSFKLCGMWDVRPEDSSNDPIGTDLANCQGRAILLRTAYHGERSHWFGKIVNLGPAATGSGQFSIWRPRDAALRGILGIR